MKTIRKDHLKNPLTIGRVGLAIVTKKKLNAKTKIKLGQKVLILITKNGIKLKQKDSTG